jgi:hypothetical protein
VRQRTHDGEAAAAGRVERTRRRRAEAVALVDHLAADDRAVGRQAHVDRRAPAVDDRVRDELGQDEAQVLQPLQRQGRAERERRVARDRHGVRVATEAQGDRDGHAPEYTRFTSRVLHFPRCRSRNTIL